MISKNYLLQQIRFDQEKHNKILILLEKEAQVRDYLLRIDEIKGEKIIIALSPFAMYELEKNKMLYKIPEDYYSPDDLYDLGMANFQKVEDLCTLIDRFILKSCKEAKERKLTPALFNFYHLKMMYDSITYRIFQLFRIFDSEKPQTVHIYDTEKYPFGNNENAPFIQYDNRESIYTQIIVLGIWDFAVKILKSDSNPVAQTNKKRVNIRAQFFSLIMSYPDMSDLAMILNKRGIEGLIKWLKYIVYQKKNRVSAALLGSGYNWDESLMEIHAEQIGPLYRINLDLGKLLGHNTKNFEGLDNIWKELLSDNVFSKSFVYNGFNFFPIVEERLQFLVKQLTKACILTALDIEQFLKLSKVKALLSPVISDCLEHSAARVAKNNGIPVITWQHGAYGAMHHPIINYLDLISSDFHFVFGEGVAQRYVKSANSYGTTLISTGSPILENIKIMHLNKKSKMQSKKTILYITSSGYQNNFYTSYYPPFSDNLFWKTQKAIIDNLGKHNEYSVIMKLHPSSIYKDPDFQSYVNEKNFDNFQFIKSEMSTVELLPLAEIIVIDLPSTTLLQALTTLIPIFVFMGHIQFDDKPFELLSRRAICKARLDDFIYELNEYLENNNYSKDVNNTDFLTMFGTYSGNAAELAAKKLREIIDAFQVRNKDI